MKRIKFAISRCIANIGVENIVKSLTDKERFFVGDDGTSWNRPNIVYRKVQWEFLNPIAFVDIYQFGDESDVGYIGIAVKSAYRRKGIASKLVADAISFLQHDERFMYAGWLVDDDNINSIRLARSSGFHIRMRRASEITYLKLLQ